MRIKETCTLIGAIALMLAGCANSESTTSSDGGVTIENCGTEVTYESAQNLFINDGNIISIALAAGAQDNIKWVSSMQRDIDILTAKYGPAVKNFEQVAKEYPSLEEVVSKQPDIYVAGWNYGLDEGKNLTPETLKEQGISSYILTESCRQEGTDKRGIVDPWEAVEIDLKNMGELTGNQETAAAVIKDQTTRLSALKAAPQPKEQPVAFVFDSASDTIFTSGSFGAPQAILDAAGAKNATSDIKDTWTKVGWEHLTASSPDVFVFVDYPGQEFEEKVKILKEHPTTRDLPAVKEGRFINLPYAMWCSSPLNIDAAEYVRSGMEGFGLVPKSDIKPQLQLPESVPGQQYLQD